MPAKVATCYPLVNSILHVPRGSTPLFNGNAMDNKEIRLANMLMLAAEVGGLQALADKTKTDAKYLSQVKNRWKGRGMGDDVARRIETALGKRRGWMDQLQDQKIIREELGRYNVTEGPALRARVPLISWTTAGRWGEIRDPLQPGEAEEWIDTTANVSPGAFALRVVGDSMEPKIPDGAIVIIDPSRPYQHGSIVLAKRTADQQATLKQLWYDGTVPKLRPLNPRYAILDMPDDTRIIGVAVRLELDL